MDAADFLQNVNDALRGTDDEAPAFGSDEASYWIRILNRKKRELYDDPAKTWSNTFAVNSTGTITASATPSFNLASTFIAPSDVVYTVTADGRRIEYDVVKPQERDYSKRQVYIAGQNPQVLYFTDEIEADEEIVGRTLYMPGFWMPADVTAEDDTIPFLSPDWAVMSVSAEIAENDITYEDKAENLNNKANALYAQMEAKNRRGTFNSPRQIPTNVSRIPGVF